MAPRFVPGLNTGQMSVWEGFNSNNLAEMGKWFSMGRENGQPSWYEDNMAEVMGSYDFQMIALSLLIVLPFLGVLLYFILLFKKERVLPAFKIFVCFISGVTLIPSMIVLSWSEARKVLLLHVGPDELPVKMMIGIGSGLWKVNIYTETPSLFSSEHFSSKTYILGNSEFMHHQHMSGLREGLVWPLVFITSLLGGEKFAWDAQLGQCLYKASCAAEPCFISSIYLWAIWCISYKVAPNKSPVLMVFFGLSLIGSVASYFFTISTLCPAIVLPDGEKMSMQIGWTGQLVGGFGGCLCAFGLGIKFSTPKRIVPPKVHTIKITKHPSVDYESKIFDKTYEKKHIELSLILEDETDNIKNQDGDSETVFLSHDRNDVTPRTPTALSQMFLQ